MLLLLFRLDWLSRPATRAHGTVHRRDGRGLIPGAPPDPWCTMARNMLDASLMHTDAELEAPPLHHCTGSYSYSDKMQVEEAP